MALRMLNGSGQTVDLSPVMTALAAAEQTATEAKAQAANTRTMILNDRERNAATIAPLAEAAAQLPVTQQAAAVEHAAIRDLIAGLSNKQATLEATVAALQALKVRVAFGSRMISGSLIAGGTVPVTVTLDKDMGSTDYSPGYSFEGGTGLLGSIVIDGITGRTANSLTVRLKNTGLVTIGNLAGGTVHVVAARSA